MLNELKIDELLDKVDSRYGLVVASAKRARQINEYTATLGLNESLGIPVPEVHTRSQHPFSIAIEELRADRLEVGMKGYPDEGAAGKAGPLEEARTGEAYAFLDAEAGQPPDETVDTGAPEDSGEGVA